MRTLAFILLLSPGLLQGQSTPSESTVLASAANDAEVITYVIKGAELTIFPFGTVVKNRLWTITAIPVCWENPEAVDASLRMLAEQSVKETWAHYSMLTFTGWDVCVGRQPGIHIRASGELPHVKAIGRYLSGRPGGMVLNFDFARWRPDCQISEESRLRCARAMVVHEFGHAIGFAHEHIRGDTPADCMEEKKGTQGTWNVTKYDPKSVMNYCNVRWLGDGRLSERDVTAVSTVYGKRV
jgi:hypothetical protein